MTLRSRFAAFVEAVRARLARPRIRRGLAVIQYALLVGVVVYLTFKLSAVGWNEVYDALPTSPLFYLIFTLRYLALPLSEIPAYELVWRRPLWRRFSAFIRKRVYNFAVMGYSGEAFLTLWARRTLDLSDRVILAGVKDTALVSAFVSNAATAGLVIALFFGGTLREDLDALPGSTILFALAFASAFSLAFAFLFLRRRIIDLPKGVLTQLILINAARMALVLALHTLLYASALPGPPFGVWFVFIALQLVLSRVPFLPNLDIVFLTAALHLASTVNVPEAAIAGMLVAEAGLAQIFNGALFIATTHLAIDRRPLGAADSDEPADESAARGRRAA